MMIPSVVTTQNRISYIGGRRYKPHNALTTQKSPAWSNVQQGHQFDDYSAISIGVELLMYVGLSLENIFRSFSGEELNSL